MTLTIAQALEQGAARLTPISEDMARREAGILLGHVLSMSATQLFAHSAEEISSEQARRFDRLLQQREQHRPVSQLIGKRAFWEHEFVVTQDVLDPRPDTELLVELALEHTQARRVLDLGTGSGCILCSVLRGLPKTTGLGVDISQAALSVARGNAEALEVAEYERHQRALKFTSPPLSVVRADGLPAIIAEINTHGLTLPARALLSSPFRQET